MLGATWPEVVQERLQNWKPAPPEPLFEVEETTIASLQEPETEPCHPLLCTHSEATLAPYSLAKANSWESRMGGFQEGGFRNS